MLLNLKKKTNGEVSQSALPGKVFTDWPWLCDKDAESK